jgi:hypothetical protein
MDTKDLGVREVASHLAFHLLRMTRNLIESHEAANEYASCHKGDARHPGEAPESCVYCLHIQQARELLSALGEDVAALEPMEHSSRDAAWAAAGDARDAVGDAGDAA